jgi:hypothetical protein
MIQQKLKLVKGFLKKTNDNEFIIFIGWRNFDDERVSTLSNVKDLVRSDAYVLFYRHRNLSVNFSVQEQLQRVLLESTKT